MPVLFKQIIYLKRGLLKSKEFSNQEKFGCKSIPFRLDPFSEEVKNNFDRVVHLASVSIPLNTIFLQRFTFCKYFYCLIKLLN